MQLDGRGGTAPAFNHSLGRWFTERARYIPLRLTYEERKQLRLIQALMQASEYTDIVDGRPFDKPQKRVSAMLRALRAAFIGVVASTDYALAQRVSRGDMGFDAPDVQRVLQEVLEIARRYKVMNPEKMRTQYGKLMYLLQDACSPDVTAQLGFDLSDRPVQTVYAELEEAGALEMLAHKYMTTATMEILPDGKTQKEVRRQTEMKNAAKKFLMKKYGGDPGGRTRLDQDTVERCLNSICDNSSFLNSNRGPIDLVLGLLQEEFAPGMPGTEEGGPCCLAIYGGAGGARLTHSHERQYMYVLQSLTLWREIVNDLFRLWYLAEEDLLDSAHLYRLVDTGQGLNRLQQSPRVSKVMHSILYAVQQRTVPGAAGAAGAAAAGAAGGGGGGGGGAGGGGNGWVGSSVIHLGDTNVPNALMFIDKYNQVS